jgi:hypothetical protein
MKSFVDLMASNVWSEADIKNRLHAEIRSQVTENAETELNRALQGAALGLHKLSPGEMASLQHFKTTTDRVEQLGKQARADAALLDTALAHEWAVTRLAEAPIEGDETDAPKRAAAQHLIDNASPETLALYQARQLFRNPPGDPATSEPPSDGL